MTIEIKPPETLTLPIEAIKPYWRNPRRIPEEAVAAVRDSIERYGYQQPIVVDKDRVVVVGHTRLSALKEMGVKQVDVYISRLPEEKLREYRVVDNRTSELSTWDYAALVVELREWEQGLLENYFPDVDLEISTVEDALVTTAEVDRAEKAAKKITEPSAAHTTQVVCPSCTHHFDVRTDTLPGGNVMADGASE